MFKLIRLVHENEPAFFVSESVSMKMQCNLLFCGDMEEKYDALVVYRTV